MTNSKRSSDVKPIVQKTGEDAPKAVRQKAEPSETVNVRKRTTYHSIYPYDGHYSTYPLSRSRDSLEGYKRSPLSDDYYRRFLHRTAENQEEAVVDGTESYSPGYYLFLWVLTFIVMIILAVYISHASRSVQGESIEEFEQTDYSQDIQNYQGFSMIHVQDGESADFITIRMSEEEPRYEDHELIWSRSNRREMEDEFTWSHFRVSGIKLQSNHINGGERSFRIPHQLEDQLIMLNKTNEAAVRNWLRFFNLRMENFTKQRLVGTQKATRNLNVFSENDVLSGESYGIANVRFHIDHEEHAEEILTYPVHYRCHRGTFSMFSSFVVLTVMNVYNDARIRSAPIADPAAFFLYSFMRAQELAFKYLAETDYFTKTTEMREPCRKLDAFMFAAVGAIVNQSTPSHLKDVKSSKIHRVTNIAVWIRNRRENRVMTLSMSRCDPFNVIHEQGKVDGSLKFYYVNSTNKKVYSRSFLASAELIIAKSYEIRSKQKGSPTIEVKHVITASGSIRTIEAVAMTVLRMVLFGEHVDEAVTAKSGFYDIRSGRFFCEDKMMISVLYQKYKLTCHEIPSKEEDFEANDRVVMSAYIPEVETELSNYIHSSINTRIKYRDINYVVGY